MTSSAPVPSTEELRAALLGAMHRQRRHLEECAARHDLGFQGAVALLQLHRPWPGSPLGATAGEAAEQLDTSPDGLPMRELADRISCDPSQVTAIADRLEHLGLVERRTSSRDRRVKQLVVTDAGHAVAEQLAAELNDDAPGLRELHDDERVQLVALLRKIGDGPG